MAYYTSQQKKAEFELAKSEYRTELIEMYKKTLLQVPAVPLKPGSLICNFNESYVRPNITRKVQGRFGVSDEIEIKSMSEIFKKKKDSLRSIYVVGDAGTGKTTFCKNMIMYWCMAHSGSQNLEDEFDGIKEMKKYDFMFHISLRRYKQIVTIKQMLFNEYREDIVRPLLEKESKKVIILLDGLDEFCPEGRTHNQFQTEGLPEQEFAKDYTILTTSRPWKIFTLRVADNEIQVLLKLKGFDHKNEKEMIYRTVSILSISPDPEKDVIACEQMLDLENLAGLKRIPLTLQHLICLWFNGKLDRTSRCSIYSSILELFFFWNEGKFVANDEQKMEDSKTVDLPQYLTDKRICTLNSKLIHNLSRLAFKTLFELPKERSLKFHISVFDELGRYSKVKENCVKLGIISEDMCPNILLCEPPKSDFSFIHKSVQEFMAAVNIAINFKNKLNLSDNLEDTDSHNLCMQFVNEVFRSCSTLDGILERSNIIIMLCGLEPRLATHVSKYVYDISVEDPVVTSFRRTVHCDDVYVCDIQELIFSSIEECNACVEEGRPLFYLGDMVIDDKNLDTICSSIDLQQISPELVLSLALSIDDIITTNDGIFFKYLPKFKHLEKLNIRSGLFTLQSLTPNTAENMQVIDDIISSVVKTIEVNVSTLKSLSIIGITFTRMFYPVCKTVLTCLPNMNNLVAIQMRQLTLKHSDVSAFCEFLMKSGHLEGIDICIDCECEQKHNVILSTHHQLKFISSSDDVCVRSAANSNLEQFIYTGLKLNNYMHIFGLIDRASKLTELNLHAKFTKSVLFHTTVTVRLVRLLPLLQNLRRLQLTQFRLHDNIIQIPSEMKNLKHISLHGVIMSLRTWHKFVDSLPRIPHPVDVDTVYLRIAADGEETTLDIRFSAVRSGKKIDAIRYVCDQDSNFKIVRDDSTLLSFETKKGN